MARGKHSGIFQKRLANSQDPDPETRVADFAYENDSLAELIAEAWSDHAFKLKLTNGPYVDRSAEAQRVLRDRGIYLTKPIIITEDEYDRGFVWENADDNVVFVLPNKSRTSTVPANQTLVETARLLMAYVPNGI